MNRLVSLFFLSLAAFCLCGSWPLLAARDKAPLPPPPVPQTIKVPRGEKAEITLGIYGSQGDQLRFLIRSKPVAGKLSEPHPNGRETALVTYEPPDDLRVTREKFSYAVQNSNGVSAATDVEIEITDAPPVLAAPKVLEFDPILAGSSEARAFEISNSGGGVSEGDVQVDPPWRVEGTHRYRLTAGARQSFKLVFAPDHAGAFESEIRYTSQPDHSTPISGRADAALTLDPAKLELQSLPGDPLRRGIFEIANQTVQDQVVTLAGGDRLHLPKSVAAPQKGRASVTVEMSADDVAELHDEIRLSGAGIELRLPVQAAAAPAVLQASKDPVRFPNGVVGQTLKAAVEIVNIGGQPGGWKGEIAPPFEISESEGQLKPSEKQSVVLLLHASTPGHFRTWLKISSEQQSWEIPVEASITGGGAGAAAPASPDRSASQSPPPHSTVIVSSLGPSTDESGPGSVSLMAVRHDVDVTDIRPTSATISWPASIIDAKDYKVEERFMSLDQNHALKIDWITVPGARVRLVGDKIVVDFRTLAPETLHAIRFSPVTADGTVRPPMFLTEFGTPAKPKLLHMTSVRVMIFLIIGTLLFLAWRKYQRGT